MSLSKQEESTHQSTRVDQNKLSFPVQTELLAVSEKKKVFWEICQKLQQLLAVKGYTIVVGGRMAQVFQSAEQNFDAKDIDIVIIPENGELINDTAIQVILTEFGCTEVKTISRNRTKEYARERFFMTDEMPLSGIVKGIYIVDGVPTEIEIFTGNENGFGYQMAGLFDESKVPFLAENSESTREVTYQSVTKESLKVFSPGALFAYYITIGKTHRSIELLSSFRDKWKEIFAQATQVSPKLRNQLLHIAEKIEQLLGDSDIENLSDELMKIFEVPSTQKALSELLLSSLKNEGSSSAGEVFSRLEIKRQEMGELLSDLKSHPVILHAFEVVANILSSVELPFHGLEHAIDVALNGVAIGIKEGYLEQNKVTEKTLAVFIGLLFHDVGIVVKNGYKNHELGSMYVLSQFIEKINVQPELKPFIQSSNLIDHLWQAVVAIYATKLKFTSNGVIVNHLRDLSQQQQIELIRSDIDDTDLFLDEISKFNFLNQLQALLISGPDFAEIVQIEKIYAIADIIAMTTKNSLHGTAKLLPETDRFNGNIGWISVGATKILTGLQEYLSQSQSPELQKMGVHSRVGKNLSWFQDISAIEQDPDESKETFIDRIQKRIGELYENEEKKRAGLTTSGVFLGE